MALPNKPKRTARRTALLALSASLFALPGVAWAQCTPAAADNGTVTCTGNTTFTATSANNLTVNVNSGATVTGPMVVSNTGAGGTLNNSGTITSTASGYAVQFGSGAKVFNGSSTVTTAVISSSATVSGSGAIAVGDNSSVTNFGTLTATAGLNAVKLGANSSFTNTASAPVAVTGNIAFDASGAGQMSTFENDNTGFGLTGSVTSQGYTTVINKGLWTGNFVQNSLSGTSVTFNNTVTGTFTGVLNTGDATTLANDGVMTLYANGTTNGNGIGISAGSPSSSFTNTGSLTLGTAALPTIYRVNGSFTQTATTNLPSSSGITVPTLNVYILPSSTSTPTPGTSYSQLYVTGAASLAGKINLNVTAGFYPDATTFKVVDALQGITNNGVTLTVNGAAVSSTTLPFLNFTSLGVVNVSGTEQAYEVSVSHIAYATALRNANVGVTANQLSIATGLQPLVATASADVTSDAAAFLGGVDVLTAQEAITFLDSISPVGYLAYAQSLRDQANSFQRLIDLRMTDQNSPHPEDGWWLTMQGGINSASRTAEGTKDGLFGFAGGYDFSGPHHVFGLAANISWNRLKYGLTNSLTGTNRDFAVAAYAGYNLGPLHLTGQVAWNMGHMGTTKTIDLTNTTRTATGAAGEHLLKATGSAGFQLKTRGLLIEPFVGIDMMRGSINSFTEGGAGAADLTVSRIGANRTDLLAGLSMTKSHGTFRPYLRAAYRDQIGSGSSNLITAYFNGDNTTSFTVVAPQAGRHELDANAGVNFVFDDAGSLFVGYQGTYRSGYQAHGINLGIRLEF